MTMRTRTAARIFASMVAAGVLGGQGAAQTPPTERKGTDVFGLAKVHEFHLEIAAKEWDKMQPAGGMRGPFGFGGPQQPPAQGAQKSADVHKGGSFGIEFPWV